ncbi:hypothetical protein NQ317_007258 [Molorchus minor]|uniref:4Fe-4S ferredoxin-type domain-containing protein n=1 Tax=Molorchus minor TaxID=1323400 RepID=A0ABQ9K2K6_9CUCU|nr:hypothetical protein NQ317_007258 [Molorchus minor]
MSKRKGMEETDKLTRIAIVNADKCKPKRCRQECKKSCPVVRMGKLCIEVSPISKIASISEELCIGCGICVKDEICELLDLKHIKDREIQALSGGELQRFACAMVCIQDGDIFMFDEPSSYLDVKQRLNAAKTIRSLLHPSKFIIVVEHDLSVLDYLSDFICCLYGVPGAYGVVTMPFSVREGINIFLDGFVPTENLRFRDESLVFKVAESANEEEVKRMNHYTYPAMSKTMGSFQLNVVQGQFSDSEILVLLGENGTGKTTFIRMLAGNLQPDSGSGDLPPFTHQLQTTKNQSQVPRFG